MPDLATAFPELENVRPLGVGGGGQKYVFHATADTNPVVLKLLKKRGGCVARVLLLAGTTRTVATLYATTNSGQPPAIRSRARPVRVSPWPFAVGAHQKSSANKQIAGSADPTT